MSNPLQRLNASTRAATLGAVVFAALGVAGCSNNSSNLPPATLPPSGITSSNGGGMRATGAIPDAAVSNGQSTIGRMPSNPSTPRY